MKYNWEELSTVRNLSILKVGYLGAISVSIYASLVFYFEDNLSLTLPFSIWASLLFFGSFLLSLAHILNETLCPQTIKTYGNLDVYRKRQAKFVIHQKTIKESAIPSIKKTMLEGSKDHEFCKNLPNDVMNEIFSYAASTAVDMEAVKIIEKAGISSYDKTWDQENSKKPKTVKLIFFLYFISLVITIILAIRQFVIVLSVT